MCLLSKRELRYQDKSQKPIYRAGRRLGISWTPGPGTVAGQGVEVATEGSFLVVIGFGMGALGAMAGRVGDLDKAPAVEHKAQPQLATVPQDR